MIGSLMQDLNGNMFDVGTRRALEFILRPIVDRYSSQPLKTATLAIHTAGASPLAMTTAAYYATVKGKLVTIAASVDMPSLTGAAAIVSPNITNVYLYFVDTAGTVTMTAGTPAATLAGVIFPTFPEGNALVGFILVTMAAAATFTPGTTNLDAANTTVVYFSPIGPFDPTVLI